MKKIVIVGTMVFAITAGGAWNNHVSASPITLSLNTTVPDKEDLLHVLKLSSDEELYNALYDGNTLSDLAKVNDVDVERVINLQVKELTEQLDQRYASGSITLQQYKDQKSEVRELITKSVYGLQ